jgi:hypothetical protein
VNNYRGRDASGNFDHNYNWFDTIDGAQVPYDDFDVGHGTHTLGTALAQMALELPQAPSG